MLSPRSVSLRSLSRVVLQLWPDDGWHLRYSLSFRDVEELLSERGLEADHTTIWR